MTDDLDTMRDSLCSANQRLANLQAEMSELAPCFLLRLLEAEEQCVLSFIDSLEENIALMSRP